MAMTTRRTALRLVGTAAAAWAGAAWAKRVPIWKTIPPARQLPATASSGYVVHDGARIYYARFGHGPPVIRAKSSRRGREARENVREPCRLSGILAEMTTRSR
jgi:hypothetical protein